MNQQQPTSKTFPVTISEPEIQMVIQNIIDDLGDVPSAARWVRNKLHSINHDILVNGKTIQSIESRDEWAIIDQYFERNMTAIIRAQSTPHKFQP
jgi:hypothetical protein